MVLRHVVAAAEVALVEIVVISLDDSPHFGVDPVDPINLPLGPFNVDRVVSVLNLVAKELNKSVKMARNLTENIYVVVFSLLGAGLLFI